MEAIKYKLRVLEYNGKPCNSVSPERYKKFNGDIQTLFNNFGLGTADNYCYRHYKQKRHKVYRARFSEMADGVQICYIMFVKHDY